MRSSGWDLNPIGWVSLKKEEETLAILTKKKAM